MIVGIDLETVRDPDLLCYRSRMIGQVKLITVAHIGHYNLCKSAAIEFLGANVANSKCFIAAQTGIKF
jgi:hypothetical protein